MAEANSIPRPILEAIEAGIPASKAFRIYSDRSIPELAAETLLEPGRICQIEAGFEPTRSEACALGSALKMPWDLVAAGTA